MAFSKVKVGGLADDSVTAANIDDDGTGYTVGNLTNSGTLQQTGQVTLGSGGTNWTLPTARGTNKYVLQINNGTADWAESLTAPEISGHNFDVSGSTDDGGINAYEAPYELTATLTNSSTTLSAITTTNIKVGQYISGAGIPADTTVSSISSAGSSNNGTIVISNQTAADAANTGVAVKVQKTPGEKNGGKVILTGVNFGANVGEISVAITNSGGSIIANASYLSGLSGGNTIVAEWTGTEGTYSTDLTSSYTGKIYFKMTKSGLASNVFDTDTTLTTDGSFTTLSTTSQTGGERSAAPSATSLGTYGAGSTSGGGQDSNTTLLLNFDRGGGTDIEDSSNTGGKGTRTSVGGNVIIEASPFGDAKSAIHFDGADDKLEIADHADWDIVDGDYTVEFWLYDISIADGEGLIGNQTGSGYSGWNIRKASGELNFNQWGSSAVEINVSSTGAGIGTSKTWRHIALVRHGSLYKLYIDGVNNGTTDDNSPSSLTASGSPLKIGVNYASAFSNCYIDEIRIVKGLAVYTGDFAVPTSRLTTTWSAGTNIAANSTAANTKLLIHSNQQITDSSSNNTAIHTHGNAGVVKEETNRGSGAHANFGSSAIYMDGTGDYLSFPISSDFASEAFGTPSGTDDDFTIEGWYKFGIDADQGLWGIDGTNELSLYYESSGTWMTLREKVGSGSSNNLIRMDWAYTTNWQHIALVRAGTTTKIYINGVGHTDRTITNNLPSFSAGELFEIGTDAYGTREFQGHIDSFRISKMAVYTGDFTPSTTALTTTWSAGTNIAANSTASNVIALIQGDGGGFVDSATTGTTHTITPTGSSVTHSQGASGIAPAMSWPGSGKVKGTSGGYFDGDGDIINLNIIQNHDYDTVFTTGVWSLDTWCYLSSYPENTMGMCILAGTDNTEAGYNIGYYNATQGGQGYWGFIGPGTTFTPSTNTTDTPPLATWFHVLMVCNWSGANFTLKVYRDGKYLGQQTSSGTKQALDEYYDHIHACIGGDAYNNLGSGSGDKHNWHGYLDNWRFSGNDVTADSSDPLYTNSQTSTSSNNFVSGLPTRAYGAFGSETPDVGTITLTATGSGDYTWSEVAAGTALPGSLAVGSTTHSGSGNSRTHTATITGAFTSSVSSNTTTSGILLKAQNDADATKAITLGSSGGYDGIGITQNKSEKPVLFNARRYFGTGANRDIGDFGFQPDFAWIKVRGEARGHKVWDSVTNLGDSPLVPDTNAASVASVQGHISKFNAGGFSLVHAGTSLNTNNPNHNFIAYGWKAGGAPSANGKKSVDGVESNLVSGTDYGAIDGTTPFQNVRQSINTAGGFNITKFKLGDIGTSGSFEGSWFKHGLGSSATDDPDFVLLKNISQAQSWITWHSGVGAWSAANSVGYLDTDIAHTGSNLGNFLRKTTTSGMPTGDGKVWIDQRSVFAASVNEDFVCYTWKSMAGVSAFGTHTGQISSVSGTTVGANGYCGFKPRWLMIKCISHSGNWFVVDAFRGEASSGQMHYFEVESNAAEQNSSTLTAALTSNGFTTGTHNGVGASGRTYISIAFA